MGRRGMLGLCSFSSPYSLGTHVLFIFAISFMGTLILVSFHNILTVPLLCLFGEAKLC